MNIPIVSSPRDVDYPICTSCGQQPSAHAISRWWDKDEFLCCECYVAAGNPPADWHPGCMIAWERKQRTKGWFGGFYPDQHPDPFPSFFAPTDTREWAIADAQYWFDTLCDDKHSEDATIAEAKAIATREGDPYDWYVVEAMVGCSTGRMFGRKRETV